MQNIAMNITYVLLEDVRISFILTFCATMLEMYTSQDKRFFRAFVSLSIKSRYNYLNQVSWN